MSDRPLMTTAELAMKLNASTDRVRRRCNTDNWPHTRIGRLYRFTEEHYQTIIEPPAVVEPWSKERRDDIARKLRSMLSTNL